MKEIQLGREGKKEEEEEEEKLDINLR